jgi:hypothetical protein
MARSRGLGDVYKRQALKNSRIAFRNLAKEVWNVEIVAPGSIVGL